MNVDNHGEMITAIASLKDRKLVEDLSELPADTRNFFKPVARTYPYPNSKVECRNIGVSLKDGVSMIEGGKSRISRGVYKFWVSLFTNNRRPVVYTGHTWTPVACFYSPETGKCVSADRYGQIHVWSAKTGKRETVFRPINQKYFHIQWMDDESGVYLGNRPVRDRREYRPNHYGPVNQKFSFRDWKFLPSRDQETVYIDDPERKDRITGETYSLKSLGSDLTLMSSSGKTDRLFSSAKKTYGEKTVKKWGVPTCYTFLDTVTDGRLPLLVGTDRGSLLQFSIERKSGKNVLKLRREFVAHEAQINSIAISPSGKRLASASLDGTVRIWQLTPARTLADVDFITDGTRVVDFKEGATSADAGLREYDALRRFGDGSYYERIQKIQRGDFKPGDEVRIVVERGFGRGDNYRTKMVPLTIELIESADIAEPLLNFFSAGDTTWIAWTRNGFYNATQSGSRHVGWHVNQSRKKAALFSNVTQFEKQLYRPDIIDLVVENWEDVGDIIDSQEAPAIGGPDLAAAMDDTPDTAEKYESIRPPEVRIRSPYGTTTTRGNRLLVKFEVSHPLQLPVTDLKIYNNNQLQRNPPKEYLVKRHQGIETITYHANLAMEPGENLVEIECEHAEATSNRASVTVNCTRPKPKTETAKPTLYVLSVGVSKYANSDFDLDYADADARDFARAWETQKGSQYSDVQTKVITNKDATVDGIEDGFYWLTSQKFQPDDVVLVFLAGHASYDQYDTWFFGSTDRDLDRLSRSGVPNDRVQRLLENEIRGAGTVILFLDTCHAGAVGGKARGESETRAKTQHSLKKDIWRGCARVVLASCQENESSLEFEEYQNGAFTESLLKSLQSPESDQDNNGKIDIQELFIKTRIEARRLTNDQQTPTISGRTQNQGVTVVAAAAESP